MEIHDFEPAVPVRRTNPFIDFHYMGIVDFDHCVALQKRLVYECSGRHDGRIVCLLAEHAPLVSIGRAGSRRHVRLAPQDLRRRQIDLRWIGRGGAAVAHGPGQLAIYPIVPLSNYGWSVGEYLQRLQNGLLDTVRRYGISSYKRPGRFGLWGRSGMLAAVGVAVQNWVTSHGAFLNVHCPLESQAFVEANPPELACLGDPPTMSSLLEETDALPTMEYVAHDLAACLAQRFDCHRATWTLSHPLLPEIIQQTRDRTRQAS